MKGFKLTTSDGITIRFNFYLDTAPITSKAFADVLPFKHKFCHARISGKEFWVANVFEFDIVQENASVFAAPGEITLGPKYPNRTPSICGSIGIYYGEGKGIDASNIFGKVVDEDEKLLISLGEKIWKQGEQELTFSLIP